MFIKALIQDKEGNQHVIRVADQCDIIMPKGFKEQMQFAVATAKLLSKLCNNIKMYAKPENRITLETDNPFIAQELQKRGYNVVFTLCEWDGEGEE